MKKLKKYSIYLLVLIISFSLIGPNCEIVAESQTIYISTTEEFLKFASSCTSDSWSKSKQVILKANIDLSHTDFSPIPIFSGVLDGGGHTISGLKIQENGSQQGLFRYLEEGATIKNLNVIGRVSPEGSKLYVGGIVGKNRGTLEKCTFSGVVEGEQYIGGLVGANESTGIITQSYVSGVIDGKSYIGGIVGENMGTIIRCTNDAKINTKIVKEQKLEIEELINGDITAEEEISNASDITDIGGIAGINKGIIQSCINKGNVGYEHVGYNVGGIAGRQSGYITGCENKGTIYGRKEVGGIVGQMEPYIVVKFTQSKLDQIGKELDTLQNLIQKATTNGHGASDAISTQLDNLQNSAKEVKTHTQGLLDQTEGLLNDNIGKVNEVSSTVAEAIDRLVPITNDFSAMGSYLENAASPVQDAISYMTKASDSLGGGVDALKDMSDELSEAMSDIEDAAWKFESGINQLGAAAEYLKTGKLREAIHSIKSTADYFEQAGSAARTGMSSLQDVNTQLKKALDYGDTANTELAESMACVSKAIEVIEDAMGSLNGALEGINQLVEYLADQPEVSFVTTDSTYQETKDHLSDALESTSDVISNLNQVINEESHLLLDDLQAVSDQLFVIFDLMLGVTEDVISYDVTSEERNKDISDTDTESQIEGKVANCTNKGVVTGDINVGGIAGAMSVDRSFDPEDDLESDGDKSWNFMFQSRAVIRACQSSGEVKAKKDSVGGIVGSMKLGYVVDSQAEGKIISNNGNYVGGIAGQSDARIQSSYAKCTLKGGDYIGGIAGQGMNISNCGAYIQVEEGKEYIGSIAGNIQEEGTISQNFFVESPYNGVDGISYAGKVEPLDYEAFIQLEGTPEMFSKFKLRFYIEEALVETIPFNYGVSLEIEALPQIPEKEGFYGEWEGFDTKVLNFDQDIEAVYKPFVSTLESRQRYNETIPIVLVQGQFKEEDQLMMVANEQLLVDEEGQTLIESWKLTIPEDGNEIHSLRYMVPQGVKHAAIYVLKDENWVLADAKKDGRYMIFEAEGDEVIWHVMAEEQESTVIVIWGIALGVLCCVVILLLIKKRVKKARDINA